MEPIQLTDELFLGQGAHKATYIDPRDPQKCIKILLQEPDIDWEREKKYRKSRKRRHLCSALLPDYYGTIETNKGTGYVFERVMDADGKKSLDMREFLKQLQTMNDNSQAEVLLKKVLLKLKKDFLQEKIVTTNMQYENFLIQQKQPGFTDFTVRIIDNIGTHSKIPLLFYVDFLAAEHCHRYWKRFIISIHKDFPKLLSDKLKNEFL